MSRYKIIKGARLPAEFQEVEYIESTGTQYIDLGRPIDTSKIITFDLKWNQLSGRSWFGAYDSGGAYNYRSFIGGYGGTQSDDPAVKVFFTSDTSSCDTIVTANTRYSIKWNGRNTRPTINGNDFTRQAPPYSDYSVTSNAYLFARNQGLASSGDYISLYRMTVENEMDLIPCYRKADNIIGLYDLINDVFYTNAGTGTFLKGNDVFIYSKQRTQRYAIIKGARLPSEFQEVEYVESSNLNSYIQTQHTISGGDKFVIDFQLTEISSGDHYLIGVFDTTRTEFGTYSNNWYAFNCMYSPLEPLNTERHKFTITYTGTFTNTNPTKIIARNGILAKIYSAEIYDSNNILLNNYIPCYRKSDNAIGLYDLVGGVFYIGTGTFAKGSNVGVAVKQKVNRYVIVESPRLPSTYQEVEYIQANGTEYINAGITADKISFDFDISYLTGTDSFTVGSRGQSGGNQYRVSITPSNVDFAFGSGYNRLDNLNLVGKHNVTFNKNGEMFYDGIKVATRTGTTQNLPIYIFALNDNGSAGGGKKGRIYNVKMWDGNNILIRNFVSCYRIADNVIGMYDLANDVFYTNAGTDTFAKGNNVSRYIAQKI